MTKTNRFALMLEALTEIVAEEKAHPSAPQSAVNSLRESISSVSPLPREALFLGLAEDGLPVLLNLYDPVPGPLLITGDSASGKTALLQIIARATDLMHAPSDVEYGIITSQPDNWKDFQGTQNCVGVYSTHEDTSQDFLHSLVSWANNNKGENHSILLLIDDLEAITKLSPEAEQNLRWLLLRGPNRRVWPIVALNAGRARSMESWLGFFRTRLFGFTQSSHDAETITGQSDAQLDILIAGTQFTMREGNKWLNFWIPNLD
jgi:hypothetical protein